MSARRITEARSAWLLPVLAALFLLSGFSALVYQVLWLRLLSLVFGVTVHAASTVLAAFMAGLALGSAAAGVLADRVRRPLVWFGAVELLVAIVALATPGAFALLERGFVALAPVLPDSVAALTAVRFVLAFLVLVVPAFLMGSTLPLVVKSSLVREGGLGGNIGLLYGANTAGAVAGALVAGFHLVGQVGIRGSFLIAAAVNVMVAVAAIAISRAGAASVQRETVPAGDGVRRAQADARVAGPRAAAGAMAPAAAGLPVAELSPAARRTVLVVFALSGLASLALEVIWFRILVVHTGATAYAFVSMLSTFLGGIAIGSWAVVPLLRRERNWLPVLVAVQAAIGIVAVYSLTLVGWFFDQPWMRVSHVVTLAIAPATLLMGAAFPIGMRLWAGPDGTHAARRIGLFYAINVCGAVAGSVAAGFLLLPRLGARWSLAAAAGLFVVSAGLLVRHVTTIRPVMRRSAALGMAAVFVLVAMTLPDPFAVALSRHPGPILWRREGVQTTVSVHHMAGGGLAMYLDGLHQANDSPEMLMTHRRIGALPFALHADPRRALVIGLGGGVTAGAAARHPGVDVDVVELSQTVVDGAAWFDRVSYGVLRAPNVRLRVDDGRNFLLLNREPYDVITADVIQPVHAGAGSVYSVEYFRLAHAALAEDGVMLQWIGDREITPYKLIMRTFLEVFPHATLWADGTLMVGTKAPLRLDRALFERKLQEAAIRAQLADIGVGSFDALLDLYTAGPAEMRALAGEGDVLTDDRPLVEYFKTLPAGESMIDLAGIRGDVRRHVAADP